MYTVLLVIHVMVTIALIGIILVQRSASDGMGLSGSSSTNFMSGRMAANFITRTTAVLAATFMLCSLGLGILTAHSHAGSSILDRVDASKPVATAPVPPTPDKTTPATTATTPAAAVTTPATAAPGTTPAAPAKQSAPSVPRPE